MTLSARARDKKTAILSRVLAEVEGDPERWQIIRRLWVDLNHVERGKPGARKTLKKQKHKEQNGLCAMCSEPLELVGSELDRTVAKLGYTKENTRLVHHDCHRADQKEKGYK